MERKGVNRARRKKLNKLRRPRKQLTLSPPDAQVEEQRKSEEPEDPQESGKDGNKPVRGENVDYVSTIPLQTSKPEKASVGGKPNDDALGPARCAVMIRGAEKESNNDFTANQVDNSDMQDERVLETGNLQETSAGGHCIRASPFAPGADSSTRHDGDGRETSNKHSIRASPFAVANEPAAAIIDETKTRGDGAPRSEHL